MPHLVQLLLPLFDNIGKPFSHALYARVRTELVAQFGGLTAYTRAPATGLWADDAAAQEREPGTEPDPPEPRSAPNVVRDDIVVYEVMVDTLDRAWWAAFRQRLQAALAQEELVVRALPVELL